MVRKNKSFWTGKDRSTSKEMEEYREEENEAYKDHSKEFIEGED